jgi:hypothetical protein
LKAKHISQQKAPIVLNTDSYEEHRRESKHRQ